MGVYDPGSKASCTDYSTGRNKSFELLNLLYTFCLFFYCKVIKIDLVIFGVFVISVLKARTQGCSPVVKRLEYKGTLPWYSLL